MQFEKTKISKMDVIRSNLKESIRLFSEERDPIPIHILVCSSYELLCDLCEDPKILEELNDEDYWNGKYNNSWRSCVAGSYNFMKHADKDRERLQTFQPELTEIVLFESLRIYSLFSEKNDGLFYIGMIFELWFLNKYHCLLDEEREASRDVIALHKVLPHFEEKSTYLNFLNNPGQFEAIFHQNMK